MASRLEVILGGSDAGHHEPAKRGRVRRCLLHEAVDGDDLQRLGARAVLRLAIRAGADVTDENFLADQSLPKHNAVGLHLLGFPGFLATPPYEAQAHRLFARFDELRSRIDHREPRWLAPVAAAHPDSRGYRGSASPPRQPTPRP